MIYWDILKRSEKIVIEKHDYAIWAMMKLKNLDWKKKELFASSCWDKRIRIWEFNNETPLKCFEAHSHHVYSLSNHKYIHNGFMISTSYDFKVKLWNINDDLNINLFYEQTLAGEPLYGKIINVKGNFYYICADLKSYVYLYLIETNRY